MKQWIKAVARYMVGIVNYIYPKAKGNVLLASDPDMADNTFAIFKYLIEKRRGEYSYTWILQEPGKVDQYKKMISEYIDINRRELEDIKFVEKETIRGLLAYVRSKYVFTSHASFNRMMFPKSQILISLWHGMPLKSIGCLRKTGGPTLAVKCPNNLYAIATSHLFQKLIAEAFSLPENQVLVAGQPRCDLIYDNNDCLNRLGIERAKYNKILLWAPTFRSREKIDKSRKDVENITDGIYSNSFPVIDLERLVEINQHLKVMDSFLIIKIHIADILNIKEYGRYSNILVIKNSDLLNVSCQVYSLLGEVDMLLTDYSSIYIDYLLVNKPIIFIAGDFDAYYGNRGFVFDDPMSYMPGEMVTDYDGLICTLYKVIVKEEDVFADERQRVCALMHEVKNSFSQNLADRLEM